MYVIKRDGQREEMSFDQITERITSLSEDLAHIDGPLLTQKVADGIVDGIKTTEIDNLVAQTAAAMASRHSEYSQLAARLAISNLHKETKASFSEVVADLHAYIDPKNGKHSPYVSDELLELATKYSEEIDSKINHERDYKNFDYFAIKTLERAYLLRLDNAHTERPQHMLMRVALGIHGDDIESAFETYELTSQKYFTHATPTLFNAGTPTPQLASCFLLTMNADSIKGIYKTLTDCAFISKLAGGIGLSVHNIRASNSFIAGTRGISNGLVPMLRNFNETARYVDQGGGKRKGSIAIYLEPWHPDIFDFLELKKNHGAEERRARDLFYGLWISDLFMKRVEEDGEWSLFCPNEVQGLQNHYGEEFEKLYTKYEQEGRARKTIKARDLWAKIIDSQIETGTPYMLFKDACNEKSNQKNLGTIKSSNLCTEIIQFTSSEETATCNLGSIAVNSFVKEDGEYDFEKLHYIAKVLTRNINKVIDRTSYPVEEARTSNFRHRPIGIGIQGLADAFAKMKYAFDDPNARKLNKDIFEAIYHGAVEASIELAKRDGAYETFEGSPASKGSFQFDLWGVTPESGRYDWEKTRAEMKKYGLRNSLLLAPMPTASTAQILGNNEAMEPFTSNLYVRRVLSGEFIVINKHLLRDLQELGIWNEDVRYKLVAAKGSVQDIDEIPNEVKERYRTVWEIPQKSIIDMSADRGAFICQSQSLNIHLGNANYGKMTALHFYAWKRGLKTGMYYLRNTASRDAVQFSVDKTKLDKLKTKNKKAEEKSKPIPTSVDDNDNPNICLSCGS